MTNAPHFHEFDSLTIAVTVAMHGKYINTKNIKLSAVRGVNTGVPSMLRLCSSREQSVFP